MAENEHNKAVDENKINKLMNLRWMVRPCDTYSDEYSDCTSIKGRFHQYFVHGEMIDCTSWKKDHNNCMRWRDEDNITSLEELISSEEKRREQRLRPHYENNTWNKRVGPPPEWDKPLPGWLQEENKATYLSVKADELRNNKGIPVDGERSYCVIS